MELSSLRMLLNPVTTADIAAIHRLHSMPETDEYNTLGIPASVDVTTAVVHGWLSDADQKVWRITLKDTREFIGLIAMKFKAARFRSAEVSYKIDVTYWGKGLATEAVEVLLAYAFDKLQLHRVEAGCAVDNAASARVLEKVGMQREGCKRKVLPIRGNWIDGFTYAILEEDYKQQKGR